MIPTYNERENLPPLIARIAALRIPECAALIVDDASPDGTGAVADTLAREHPWVRVLHRARKDGLGAAYVAGFRKALKDDADIIVQMDADGSHDPAEIPAMLRAIADGADVVVGSRRIPGGRIVGWNWHRRAMSWCAQAIARWLLELRTRDVTSGFRAWRAGALNAMLGIRGETSRFGSVDDRAAMVPRTERGERGRSSSEPATVGRVSGPERGMPSQADTVVATGYAFQEEMLFRAERAGARITEYPITFRDRSLGQSKLGIRDVLGFFRTLARLWLEMRDRRFALGIGALLVFATAAPYLYGWWNTPSGFTYTGIHGIAAGDMSVYASYLEQVRDGRALFTNLFTTEPHARTLNIFWLAAGWFARLTHLPAPAAFHALRLLLIIPFTLFLATFVAAFLRKPIAGWSVRTVRRTALVFLAFSSGVGAYIAPALEHISYSRPGSEYWPIDLWVAESNTFLTLSQTPHFIVSLWLLLLIFLFTLRASEGSDQSRGGQSTSGTLWSPSGHGSAKGGERGRNASESATLGRTSVPEADARPQRLARYRCTFLAGLTALALFQFHPFYVPTIATVLIAFAIAMSLAHRRIRWDLVAHALIVLAISAPSIAYHSLLTRTDAVVAWKAAQNLLFTPSWWLALAGYGFLVPLALMGMASLLRRRTDAYMLLIAWFAATVALIFSPLIWQRRLTEGLHVVIVLVAMFGLFPILTWIRSRISTRVLPLVWTPLTAALACAPLFGVSTAFNVSRDIELYTIRFPASVPRHVFYFPNDAIAAMRWIHAQGAPDEATLALGLSGNFLPMYAVRPTVIGHGVETADFARKYRTAYALAAGTVSDDDAAAFLAEQRVRFILVTDDDRPFWVRSPAELPGVALAFVNDGAWVYRVGLTE